MNVCVVGAGYVGLVTALCFAERGHYVICVDVDAERIARLDGGVLPVYERGLDELLERHLGRRFVPTTNLTTAVHASELTIVAVGTPLEHSGISLRFIGEAARGIGGALRDKRVYHVVVIKSTVIPGTTSDFVRPILEEASRKQSGRDFGLGMNPEFLREGEAVDDFQNPDRIVIGAVDDRSLEMMTNLYADFAGVELIRTNTTTAEMIKYASNSLLATLISFSNEIGNLCSAAPDVDVVDVLDAVTRDKRISPISDGRRVIPPIVDYLRAGCGFGGSCFPKDVSALIQWGDEHNRPTRLLRAVLEGNHEQPAEMVRLLKKHFADLGRVRVAVLGLAFKAGTDDIRESPALRVIRDLVAEDARVIAYDPVAAVAARTVLGDTGIRYVSSAREAVIDAQAVLILTAWPEFQQLPETLETLANSPVVIDGRRTLNKKRLPRYEGIGLGDSSEALGRAIPPLMAEPASGEARCRTRRHT
jgi:UDPglucose 6-dehydrogenase/GDP-mannose 6-dehydrogenase